MSAADNFLRNGKPGSAFEAAQVHATLALAAATALPQQRILTVAEYKAWVSVAGERPKEESTND